jgi:two-component system, NarL family, response regulator DevR
MQVRDLNARTVNTALDLFSVERSIHGPSIAGSVLAQLCNVVKAYLGEDKFAPLTSQESQILHCIADQMTNREIGAWLQLSEKTVKNYVTRIYSKLEAEHGALATAIASERRTHKRR